MARSSALAALVGLCCARSPSFPAATLQNSPFYTLPVAILHKVLPMAMTDVMGGNVAYPFCRRHRGSVPRDARSPKTLP